MDNPKLTAAEEALALQERRLIMDLGKHLTEKIEKAALDTLSLCPPEGRPALLLYVVNSSVALATAAFMASGSLPDDKKLQDRVAAGILRITSAKFFGSPAQYAKELDTLLGSMALMGANWQQQRRNAL